MATHKHFKNSERAVIAWIPALPESLPREALWAMAVLPLLTRIVNCHV